MTYKIFPARVEYLSTNGVTQGAVEGTAPYPEFDVVGGTSAQGYKYARFFFDVNSLSRTHIIEGFGFRGNLTDKTLYGQALKGRMVYAAIAPNGFGPFLEYLELGNAPSANVIGGQQVNTPLVVDAEKNMAVTVGETLDQLYQPQGLIPLVVGLGRITWGTFANTVGILTEEAYLLIAGDPPPEDARDADLSRALNIRASFRGSQKPVPREFRTLGPSTNMTIGNNIDFEETRAASYKIRIGIRSPDNMLDIDNMFGSIYGYFYTDSGAKYTETAYLNIDSDGIHLALEGMIDGGAYVDISGLYFYMSLNDYSGATDTFAIEVEEFTLNISGETPPNIPQPPQPEFEVQKNRPMLSRPGPWYDYHGMEDGGQSHIGYLVNLGDEVSGTKPLQHLVTMDVPGQRVMEGTISNDGLVIAVADYERWQDILYTLPVPGASKELDYEKQPKMMYRWRSKMFVFPGRTTLAAAKVVTCGCGQVIFRLYERGREVFSTVVCNSEPFRLPPDIVGVEFQVELQGTAEVHEVHVASSMRELIEEG